MSRLGAARAAGWTTICDTSRAQLANALGAHPDLVTPNLAEATSVLNGSSNEAVEATAQRELQEETYGTQTRGERRLPAVRPAGEGVYAISLNDGEMRLAYALELPEARGEVQREFGIPPAASFVLSVKNPEKGQPRAAGLTDEQKADYPDALQRKFRGRRFAGEDVRLLDVEGAEFLLVGANTDHRVEKEEAVPDPEDEDYAHAEIIRDLKMVKSRHPVAPLIEGEWE
jgi:hypothetical protein